MISWKIKRKLRKFISISSSYIQIMQTNHWLEVHSRDGLIYCWNFLKTVPKLIKDVDRRRERIKLMRSANNITLMYTSSRILLP
jgi:hypothetical protein